MPLSWGDDSPEPEGKAVAMCFVLFVVWGWGVLIGWLAHMVIR